MKLKKLITGLIAASIATISVNGIAGTDTATLNISATAVTGYAIIPHSQAITPGLYSDNITITLTY